jgi:hypothetical protein
MSPEVSAVLGQPNRLVSDPDRRRYHLSAGELGIRVQVVPEVISHRLADGEESSNP